MGHRGYSEIDEEDTISFNQANLREGEPEAPPHKLYGWEPCGFLKQAGMGEMGRGTFKSVDELITVIRRIIGAKHNFGFLQYEPCAPSSHHIQNGLQS